MKQEWLPLECNIPSSLHWNWYYYGFHWDSSGTCNMASMRCLFYAFHNNSKSLWTQWGQEVLWTLHFHCITALQLWQHTGMDASWSRGQHWLATVLSAAPNCKGKSSQCLIRHHTSTACGMSHQPHIKDTLCSTTKSQLPDAFNFCDVTQHTLVVVYWCFETV